MRLKYGPWYDVNVNGVKTRGDTEVLADEGGQIYATLERVTVEGDVTPAGGAPPPTPEGPPCN